MSMTSKEAIRIVCEQIVDAIKTGKGSRIGIPGGHLYAVLMNVLTLEQFETIMRALVRGGYLRKSGQCYFYKRDFKA